MSRCASVGGSGLATAALTGALIHADELLAPEVVGSCCGPGSGVRAVVVSVGGCRSAGCCSCRVGCQAADGAGFPGAGSGVRVFVSGGWECGGGDWPGVGAVWCCICRSRGLCCCCSGCGVRVVVRRRAAACSSSVWKSGRGRERGRGFGQGTSSGKTGGGVLARGRGSGGARGRVIGEEEAARVLALRRAAGAMSGGLGFGAGSSAAATSGEGSGLPVSSTRTIRPSVWM